MGRRKEYRSFTENIQELDVSVRLSGGPSFSSEPLDVSFEGATVRLLALRFHDVPRSPLLAVGEYAELIFTFRELGQPIVASARVVRRTDDEGSRHYGFQFTDHEQLQSQLSPRLYRFFNRRGAFRVKPAADGPVAATLEGGPEARQVHADLVDISFTGVSLRVPLVVESTLAGTDRIKVSISLPDCPSPVNFEGIIRSRHVAGVDTVKYGIEFDLERSDDGQRQEDAINRYMMERQRAVCRAAKRA